MIISHLVAASENSVIGKNNHIPWHLPNDLKFFKNKSWGMPVIMGRNTYESLDKPLQGRINVVISAELRQVPWNIGYFSQLHYFLKQLPDGILFIK